MSYKERGASGSRGKVASVAALLALAAVLASPSGATFGGRDGRITFARFVEKTNSIEIFSSRPNGRDLQQLTSSGRGNVSFLSDWSPSGRRIAFDSDRKDTDGRPNAVQVYVMRADGSRERQLTRGPGFHGSPGWSPDGDQLVIDADWGKPRAQGIWIIPSSDPNGVRRSEARRLTKGPAGGNDEEPQFCAGGRTVVFTRFKTPRLSAIYRVGIGGGGLRRLTPFSLNASDPDCSPSGRKITFDSGDFGGLGSMGNIYVIGVDGSGLRRLTTHPRIREGKPYRLANNPVWSPSGDYIMYTQFRDRRTLIMRMDSDGTGKRVAVRVGGGPNKVDWGRRR